MKTLSQKGPPAAGMPPVGDESSVVSEIVTFENRRGMRIVGCHDYTKAYAEERRWMIVLPGFGETKTEALIPSYFLAKNGFHTLRIDYSDHVGESEGDISCMTLTKIKDDILSSLDYVCGRFHVNSVGALGSSIASRALLRAAREDDRIRLILNLVCVVDLRKTLVAIYNEDYVECALRGLKNGVMDVLGFQVDADHLIHSIIQDGLVDLRGTIEDVKHINNPTFFFVADNDAWVEFRDVEAVFRESASNHKDLIVLKGAMHRLLENPSVVREALRQIAALSHDYLSPRQKAPPLVEFAPRDVGAQIRREKERNKLLHPVTKEQEREFWKGYLEKFSFSINIHDYWNLFELIWRLLSDLSPGWKILDAGCGIGNYGTFLLMKMLFKTRQRLASQSHDPRLSWVGVDFVEDAVLKARLTHGRLLEEFAGSRQIELSYCIADLDLGLPFADCVFDQICCNLVVSYVVQPEHAVAEMARVLKPGGRMVLTSLKPFADLSGLYRNFIGMAETQREIEEARQLLSNAGRVKAKEAEGIYRFYSEEELTDLLREAGCIVELESYRSLAEQANIVRGIKD